MKETYSLQEIRQLYSGRGFGRRVGFGKMPAVLVIDFQNAFTDERTPIGSDLRNPLQQTVKILRAARKVKIPIIFTAGAYEPSLGDAGVWAKKVPLELAIMGTDAVEIDTILEKRHDEPLIVKKYPSAFFGTDLVSRLNAQRVDTIILTGCTTSGCVRATAVDGVSYGFRVIVAEEAVGDRAKLIHLVSLADIDAKYGDVVSVSRVLEYLTGKL